MTEPIFIAEIKTQSPFGYKSEHPFISIMEYAIKYGDWISVHTNALWGGDYDAISFVRRNTNKPILAKGIHASDDDIKRAIDHGADYVLVVDRLVADPDLKDWDGIFYEISNIEKFIKGNGIPFCHRKKFVCNSRDLKTGLTKMKCDLPTYFENNLWTCQASGIVIPQDVNPKVQAFIVGQNLIHFCQNL